MRHLIITFISAVFAFNSFAENSLSYVNSKAKNTYKVKFRITNIRDNYQGNFVICFFGNRQEFDEGNESIRFEVEKTEIINNELSFELELPEGDYGAVVLDDENKNDAMDFRAIFPIEGFGFTNFYPLFRPNFKDFKFPVPYSSHEPIEVKLRYWFN